MEHVERIQKFLPMKHKIAEIMDEDFINGILREFDERVEDITDRLRSKKVKELKEKFANEIKNIPESNPVEFSKNSSEIDQKFTEFMQNQDVEPTIDPFTLKIFQKINNAYPIHAQNQSQNFEEIGHFAENSEKNPEKFDANYQDVVSFLEEEFGWTMEKKGSVEIFEELDPETSFDLGFETPKK